MGTLNPAARSRLATRILECLERAIAGSTSELRGSLATGHDDPYSDIDVLWTVPDRPLSLTIDGIAGIVDQIHPLESLRLDPSVRGARRHLYFARFQDVPLFWRLDLEVVTAEPASAEEGSESDSRGDSHWSRTESALMNAVAAVKAHLRGDDVRARTVLLPGYKRVDLKMADSSLQDQILGLVEGVRRIDSGIDDLAGRVEVLVIEAFTDNGTPDEATAL